MRTEPLNIYTWEELSQEAKDKAVKMWVESAHEDVYYDFVFEDAAHIAELFGLDLRQTLQKRTDGSTYYAETIYFSGFWSQGDGACFEGRYEYKKGALKAVKDYAPKDKEMHRIVKGLTDLQRTQFYRLTASCKHRGHYYHSGCMDITVENSEGYEVPEAIEASLTEYLRDFADWIYKLLEEEYEYHTSKESAIESLSIGGYEFLADGTIY